ncbi:dipeptidase 1-like isoform X2 [Chironomus tepperi]|uniref:dipeptidase 1-like isoform X2 n=1 Tax=Chironomus tepperi TaxID=113505 RepID=UPI00391F36D5
MIGTKLIPVLLIISLIPPHHCQLSKGSDILNEVPLIDGHNDLPYNLYRVEHNRLKNFRFNSDLRQNRKWVNSKADTYTDLPRLRKGKVGGQFWVAFVECDSNYCDAVERTIDQIDVIKRLIKKYPKDLEYVTQSDQIMEAFNAGKIASMIEIEGGHSIDSRLSALRLFYELGVRCMTLTHNCNTPWADNNLVDSTPDSKKKGLTRWGQNVVKEMNRLGMIVDISHVSEGVMVDTLRISSAPVIFSHSSVFSIVGHTRNVKDHVLKMLKKNRGVIMINFAAPFVSSQNATIYDVVKHINYVKNLIGVDHIGIGADYDGVAVMPKGLEDVSKYPAIFDILAEGGKDWTAWTPEELKKLAGLNLIRIFREVEEVRDRMKNVDIIDDPIPYKDVMKENPDVKKCRLDVDHYKNAYYYYS